MGAAFELGDQYLALFLGVNNGSVGFTANYQTSSVPIWAALAVPQAWTLGVELSFYCLAPFLLRCRTRVLLGVAATLLGGRWGCWLGSCVVNDLELHPHEERDGRGNGGGRGLWLPGKECSGGLCGSKQSALFTPGGVRLPAAEIP